MRIKDEEKQNTSTTQYVLDTTICKHRKNNVNKTCTLLQTTGGKDDRIYILLCGNRNRHHNTKLRLETLCIHVVYIANWSTKNI